MDKLAGEIGEMVGASVIWAPITAALVWFVFWTARGAQMRHLHKMLLSCGIVSVALFLLSFSLLKFDARDVLLDQFWIVVWFFVGLVGWRSKPKKRSNAPHSVEAKAHWDAVLCKSNLSMTRDEIIDFHKMMNAQGEAEGGAYLFPKEYIAAWETFRDHPSIDNARALLEIAPELVRYFEDCSPGSDFYATNTYLKPHGLTK